MPKLLIVNVSLNFGSTGRIVEGIGKMAIADGWEVYVAHGARYKNASSLKGIQLGTKAGEVLHYLKSALLDAQGLGSRRATRRFLKRVEELQPDLVHIHNIHGCFLNYPLLFQYLKERRIPVVWTLHDCWAMTGHCAHFERTHCGKWKDQCGKCPQKRDFPASWLLDRSKNNFALKKQLFTAVGTMRITTVSSWLRGVAEQSYLKGFPVDEVPNGVDTDVFVCTGGRIRSRFGIGDKKLVLAVASGFGRRKGIDDYVSLSERLPADYQLLLVGVSGRDKRILPDKVMTVSRTDGAAELAAFYSAADVLLSLSYEETFGLTIVEAMACGTPAIVYDNTAQPELVTPETGLVVPAGDMDALVKAIAQVCSRPKELYEAACRSRGLEYDEKQSYQKYLRLYSAICNKP